MIETKLTDEQLKTLYYRLTTKVQDRYQHDIKTGCGFSYRYYKLHSIRDRVSLEESRRLKQRHKEWNYR